MSMLDASQLFIGPTEGNMEQRQQIKREG